MASTEDVDPRKAWDVLRRQARKLESELDSKLSNYTKLHTSESFFNGVSPGSREGEIAVDALEADIDVLLNRLTDTNDALSRCCKGDTVKVVSTNTHTLARHRDILHELTQEFKRARANHARGKARAELLGRRGGSGDSLRRPVLGINHTPGVAAATKESLALMEAGERVDSMINQARSTNVALGQQRSLFNATQGKLGLVNGTFSTVLGTIDAIQRKKDKDTIILGVVISCCVFFLFIYWLWK